MFYYFNSKPKTIEPTSALDQLKILVLKYMLT